MAPSVNRRHFLGGAAGLSASLLLGGCAARAQASGAFPRQFVWSTYGIGTGTYNDMASLANVLTRNEDVPVRIITSDTGVGRIAPLINGTAQYSRAADEYFYAFEGEDEFATELWGPQPIRQVWAPPTYAGILVMADSGIETVSDLAGRRFPDLVASTALNRKLAAILDYGGLTTQDVTSVRIAYSEQADALRTGQIEALYQNVTSPSMTELASEYDVRWLDLGGEDDSRYASWAELAPTTRPRETGQGATLSEENRVTVMEYSLPITTTPDRSFDEVLELMRAIDRNFPDFGGTTLDSVNFAPDRVLLDPLMVPLHDGAVAYFTETGRWTPDLENRNRALLGREELMKDAWPDFFEAHSADDRISETWKAWKRENLPPLPAMSPS